MWEGFQGNSGGSFLKGMSFYAGFVVGVAGILIICWKSTTLSGEGMVDRTNLLI
jgi:hypothetical protein